LNARLRPEVVTIGALAGLASGAALLVSILGRAPLSLAATFFLVPALVAFLALTVTVRREQQQLFLARLRVGALAGLLGTAAYDLLRGLSEAAGLATSATFQAIPAFGAGLTGRAPADPASLAAGWAFHFCNGVGFAIAYTMVCAGRPWWWAVAYALLLEAMLVSLYPGWLAVPLSSEFVSVSVAGHLAYGVVLGALARRSR